MLQQTQYLEETEKTTESTPIPTLETSEPESRLSRKQQKSVLLETRGDARDIEDWLEFLRDKKKPRWRERRLAIERLASACLTPEQREETIDLLVATAKSDSSLLKFAVRRGIIGAIGAGGLIAATLIWNFLGDIGSTNPITLFLFSILIAIGFTPLLALVFCGVFAIEGRKMNRVRMTALKALADMRAVEGLGVLLTAAKMPSQLRQFDGALLGMLDSLTPMHYGTLPTHAVPLLCDMIGHEHRSLGKSVMDTRVIILLKALGNIGDGRALAFVTKLVQTGKTDSVRIVARDVVPILEERKRMENEFGMLLRHSSVPINPKNDLLRAAHSQPDIQYETLVRPVETPME